jgi:hypothetical protein
VESKCEAIIQKKEIGKAMPIKQLGQPTSNNQG